MANKVPKFSVSRHKQVRNAFDLSQSHIFSAAPGQLYPILALDCMPDDVLNINVTDFVKSMPIVQAPLCNARGVYEFFFVPYHQLWHNFDQFITQMNDYRSSYFAMDNPPSSVPSFGTYSPDKDHSQVFYGSPLGLSLQTDFYGTKDLFGFNSLYGRSTLYDLLGYSPICMDTPKGSAPSVLSDKQCPNYSLNLFRLAAYQKIYQDYYRKTSYETFDVSSYSLDNVPSNGNAFSKKLSELHYRNYGLDLLTNVRPTAVLNVNNQRVFSNILPRMFGTDSVGILSSNLKTGSITEARYSSSSSPSNISATSNTNNTMFGSPNGLTSPLSSISVQSVRAAFALDKLSQIIGRAEKDFKSQMLAVYGVNANTGRDGKCIFIDGFSSDISFGEIDNTNGSSYGSSYSTFGKVFGNGNGHIKFKCPEFGVLMCIYSIIPFVPYDSTYVDRFNTKHSYSDYFNPLYQRLGLQPLYQSELDDQVVSGEIGNPLANALGWQPRYSEYKTAVDRNHMGFNDYGSLRSFTASRSRAMRQDLTSDGYLNKLLLRDLKISPSVFNSVFTVDFDGSQSSMPFFNKVSFNIVKVSAMDTDSLPML